MIRTFITIYGTPIDNLWSQTTLKITKVDKMRMNELVAVDLDESITIRSKTF